MVAGVDEVGKGAWAGPLAVGVAVIPSDRRVYKIRDSKVLKEPEREKLYDRIADWCRWWAVGMATHTECDRLGMSEAQKLAAERAFTSLGVQPDRVLVDGNWDFTPGESAIRIVKGDRKSLTIASAAILAKVTRDRMMRGLAQHYPQYGFDSNKGYPETFHQTALMAWGPSAIHRRSWSFMDNIPWNGLPRYGRPEQDSLF